MDINDKSDGNDVGNGHGVDDAPATPPLSVAAKAAWVACNSADGTRLSACYRLYRECVADKGDDSRPGYAVIDPFDVCSTRLVALFAVSLVRAGTMTSLAIDLTERYPAVLAALAAGRLEQRIAQLLARQMRTVDPEVVLQVQQQVVDAYLAAIESGERPGDGAVREMVDEIIRRVDADGIRRRREDASRDRGASIRKGADGMATLWATLAADEAAALSEAIDRRAAEFANPNSAWNAAAAAAANASDTASGPAGDSASASASAGAGASSGSSAGANAGAGASDNPADMSRYSVGERRADALMSLVLGEQPGGHPGEAASGNSSSSANDNGNANFSFGSSGEATGDCANADANANANANASTNTSNSAAAHAGGHSPTPGAGMTPLRPRVTVFAPAGASGTDGAEPEVQFPRTGESSIAALLAMLGSGSGATIERIDPEIGAANDPRRGLEYRPSAALARAVRLRDGTCRHPGCDVAAEYCDLDHFVPFNHGDPSAGGRTDEENLGAFCRRHHRFKHFSGWNYSMDPDGTLIVTTPDGEIMITRPSGPLAAHRREVAKVEQDKWDSQVEWEADHLHGEDGPPDEPTYWHRRALRIRAERKAARDDRRTAEADRKAAEANRKTAKAEDKASDAGANNIPTIRVNFESRVERQLAELLDCPPF